MHKCITFAFCVLTINKSKYSIVQVHIFKILLFFVGSVVKKMDSAIVVRLSNVQVKLYNNFNHNIKKVLLFLTYSNILQQLISDSFGSLRSEPVYCKCPPHIF